ncbi:hypothetical protein CEUSTIGMA_g213.t1 [Chlamydomonas eustigma]|uniref:SAWADEE domain-containing protein n=1 Tax=Chlamydomonas eustigma TaxID=1157962 RepID=A0A250WPI9_9CHLO|nr:hypothetical protein CEUSTIGMA_g213.t1 [Chlamydomonas eustigma]|eukprot:GAX72757.1 hypothetical protein CEUSTIGMA_g213.t1 [Chlamydomonas eustigma]
MPKRGPELLECLWFGDGSWYDVDDKQTHVVNEGGNGPHLLVRYDNPADPNDKEAVPPDQVLPRLRCRSRAIQDSECKGLRVGAKVVALYVLSEQERLYYDACVVDVERKEHGTDDGDCTCQFTCEWMKPPPFLPPSVAVKVPTGKFVADIGGLCAIGSLGHLHPKVKQWMAEIKRLQRGKTRSTASPATSASKAETTSFVPTAATSQLVATSASIPKENITTTSFTQAATLTQASHNQSESAAAPPVLNSIVHPAAIARATLTDNYEIGVGKQSGVESHKARRAILSQDKTDTPGSAGEQAISLHDKTETPGSAGQQAISLHDKTDTPGSAGQQAISLHDKTDTLDQQVSRLSHYMIRQILLDQQVSRLSHYMIRQILLDQQVSRLSHYLRLQLLFRVQWLWRRWQHCKEWIKQFQLLVQGRASRYYLGM